MLSMPEVFLWELVYNLARYFTVGELQDSGGGGRSWKKIVAGHLSIQVENFNLKQMKSCFPSPSLPLKYYYILKAHTNARYIDVTIHVFVLLLLL